MSEGPKQTPEVEPFAALVEALEVDADEVEDAELDEKRYGQWHEFLEAKEREVMDVGRNGLDGLADGCDEEHFYELVRDLPEDELRCIVYAAAIDEAGHRAQPE
jgi:hypothetical protein